MSDNKRLDYIDIAKFIGIYLMVSGHIGLSVFSNTIIHYFHMPLFFFLSGLTFNFDKYQNISFFIKRRVKTLIKPYLLGGFLLYVFWYTVSFFNQNIVIANFKTFLINLFANNAIDSVSQTVGMSGIIQWFLTSLFFCELVFWFVCRIFKNRKNRNTIVLFVSLLISSFIYVYSSTIKFNFLGIYSGLISVVFYATGYVMKDNFNKIRNKFNSLFLLFLVIALLIISLINGEVNTRKLIFGNYILYYFGAFLGILIIINLSNRISNTKINSMFVNVGSKSLIILMLNRLIQYTIINPIKDPINNLIQNNMVKDLLTFIIYSPLEILIIVYFDSIYKKILELVYSKFACSNKVKICYTKRRNMGDSINEIIYKNIFNVDCCMSNYYCCDITGIGSGLRRFFVQPNSIKNILRYIISFFNNKKIVIWSAGFLETPKGNELITRKNMVFASVRGELSKKSIEQILNKEIDCITGDGGLLASDLLKNNEYIEKKYDIGIIPHDKERNDTIVGELKKYYSNSVVIDVREDPLVCLKLISQCKTIISSSLHGLIFADSFNIPNLHICLSNKLSGDGFKFDDYYSSFGVKHNFINIYSKDDFVDIDYIVNNYCISKSAVEHKKQEIKQSFIKYIN